MEFHPQNNTLLASGSADGELFVWDLKDPLEPVTTRPRTQKVAAASKPGITCIAWNLNKKGQVLFVCEKEK